MKRFLTLLIAASLSSLGSEAAAPDPTEVIVERELLKPLAAKEKSHSRFSRSRLPPQARRVRVLDPRPQEDESGAKFVKFTVDARYGLPLDDDGDGAEGWRKDTLTGCVYPDGGAVFVLRGGLYFPASFILGKREKPAAAHTCTAASPEVASVK